MVVSRSQNCACVHSFISLLLAAAYVLAGSTNRTIDDTQGDSVTGAVPSYSPAGGWNVGQDCNGCFVQPDHSSTYKGTWHDSTYTPGDPEPRAVTAQFTGTAVYVYHVVANSVPFADTLTNLTFSLDGEQVGTFVHIPTESTDYQYNVPVYTNPKLPNKEHTIVIQATGDTHPSLILFDYIVYTYTVDDLPPPPPPPPPSTSSIPTTSNTPTSTSTSTSASQSSTQPLTSPSTTSTSLTPTLTNLHISASNTFSDPFSGSPPPSSTSSESALSQSSTSAAAKSSQDDSGSPFPVGAVVGAVAGVVVIVLVAILLFYFLRRRIRNQDSLSQHPGPEMEENRRHRPALGDGYDTSDSEIHPSSATSQSHLLSSYAPSEPSVVPPSTSSSRYSTSFPSTVELSRISTSPRLEIIPRTASTLRSIPDVPTSPSNTSPVTTTGQSNYASTTATLPPMHLQVIDEKPPILLDAPKSGTRMLPTPPTPISTPSVLRAPSTSSGSGNVAALRTQLAALEEEVARLREEREMQMLLDEAPPRYDEARA